MHGRRTMRPTTGCLPLPTPQPTVVQYRDRYRYIAGAVAHHAAGPAAARHPAPACCGPSSRASPPASTPPSPSRSPRAAQTADQPQRQSSQSSCSQPTTGLLGAPRAVPTSTSPPATPLRPRRSTSDPRGPSPAAAGHHHRLSSCPSLRRLTPRGPDRPPAPPRAPTRPRRGPRRPPARPRAEAPSLDDRAAAFKG